MELKLGLLLRTPSTTGKAYSRDQYQLIIAPNLTTGILRLFNFADYDGLFFQIFLAV
jgi:hypothetical protein